MLVPLRRNVPPPVLIKPAAPLPVRFAEMMHSGPPLVFSATSIVRVPVPCASTPLMITGSTAPLKPATATTRPVTVNVPKPLLTSPPFVSVSVAKVSL